MRKRNSRQAQWARQIGQNHHEIYVLSMDEMETLVSEMPLSKKAEADGLWNSIKGFASFGANWGAAAKDAYDLTKLVGMMGGGMVGFKAQVYIKYHDGKHYIILKGYAGLRKFLTGTRYLANNAKVVNVGLGHLGAAASIKNGGILGIIFATAFRVAEFLLSDEQSLARLIGGLAADVVKVGIVIGATVLATKALAKTALMMSFAIGPMGVVVLAGFGFGYLVWLADEHFGLTERLIETLEVTYQKTQLGARSWHEFFSNLPNDLEEVSFHILDFALDVAKKAAINTLDHHLNKVIPRTPRFL